MNIISKKTFVPFFVTAIALGLAGCSAPKTTSEISDPWEKRNRAVHGFNQVVDKTVAEPIAKGYRAAVPTPARKGVRNVLRNLKTPTNLANELLQGDLKGAGNVVTRASVNTILGVGGLFDIAGHEGIPYHSEDFGQTLAVWGVDHGPYLVIPFFGPGSVRDYAGTLVDVAADPLNHWMLNTGRDTVVYVRAATTFVDTREGLLDVLSDLRNNSIDYYATLRSVYTQNRNNLISDGKASAESLPEFE